MAHYHIHGGNILSGEIRVYGNKNAVLPLMAASILTKKSVQLTNVPRIQDVLVMIEILEFLGAEVSWTADHELTINTKDLTNVTIPLEYTSKLRASVLLLGPLYARFGKAVVHKPGGDAIGKRSIDTHLDCFAQLGAQVNLSSEYYSIEKKRQSNPRIIFDEQSVTATENIIMASSAFHESLELYNAAQEPHVSDLLMFMQKAGAQVRLQWENTISIKGPVRYHEISHTVMPDYIEAGTLVILGMVSGGKLTITGCSPHFLTLPLLYFKRFGAKVNFLENGLSVSANPLTSPIKNIQALPHPGFPTDLISPTIVLATQAHGATLIHDPLYESRMFFVDKLIKMG